MHITYVYNLAEERWRRYQLFQEKEDLDKSIVLCTEAILLPSISRDGAILNNIFQLLFHLAYTLMRRSERFEQPESVKYSIKYLRYLRGLVPLDSFNVSRNFVTTSLIQALGIQVRLCGGNSTRDFKEMVVLGRELLTSNLSADFYADAFISLIDAAAADSEFRHGVPSELLDEAIECVRGAVKVCPQASYLILLSLAGQLFKRFLKTHSIDDYEETMALFENILDPNRPGGCPDLIRGKVLSLAASLTFERWTAFETPEYSEVAISRIRAELGSPSIDEHDRLRFASQLSILAKRRFRDYSLSESLEEANFNNSQIVGLLSSQTLAKSGSNSGTFMHEVDAIGETYSTMVLQQKIQHLEELLSNTPPGTEPYKEWLMELVVLYRLKSRRTNITSDIKESVKYCRLWLDATRSSDPWWKINPLSYLRDSLHLTFEKTSDISYLDEAITIGYDILELKTVRHALIMDATQWLVGSLLTRKRLLGRIEDIHEAIRLISVVINRQFAQEPDRFRLSCQWAILARNIGHPSTLTAYKSAMSLMQKSLTFAPTVSVQHTRLVDRGENCQTMPLHYASYQINLGQFEEAVETLEQGRALIWSEMREFRTPIAQLIEKGSPLAKRFAEVNQELEALTISATPSGKPEIEDGVAQGRDGTDPFGRLLMKQQKLVEERDALISQIQNLPGLEGFLRAPSFAALRSAASRGPVIIINHCEYRSDIIIIFHRTLPCSIPTIDGFFYRANELRDELVDARKHGLGSCEYQDALCSVLKGLYELVGEPVIKRLRLLGVPEQSRIWWCPTSVFCSLPLHAMGPIPSSNTRKRYFSDLYIPSYTPSLSALIEPRKGSQRALGKPSLLLVAQPDDSLPGVTGEIKVIERALHARVAMTRLVSGEATPSSVREGLRGSQFAHFACHGVLEAGKPFDASFKLHGGSRLTLLDIARSRVPDAEIAFLSCCHAAEITADSISDEALHLTAAMQHCGFRSVVGTMWEMADTDGQDLAKNFYKSLFSSQDSGVPYYERSAVALRDATQKLRGKRGITLERWVNFVQYGA